MSELFFLYNSFQYSPNFFNTVKMALAFRKRK